MLQRLSAQHPKEVTEFIFHFARIRHRVSDFLTQELTVALSQTMGRHPQRAFADRQTSAHLRVRNAGPLLGEAGLQLRKQSAMPCRLILLSQLLIYPLQECNGPTLLKDLVRRLPVRGFKAITGFGRSQIKRDYGRATPAFLSLPTVASGAEWPRRLT